jgi:hypothetical protein
MQFPYNAELARLTGSPPPARWREAMYNLSGRNKRDFPDEWVT